MHTLPVILFIHTTFSVGLTFALNRCSNSISYHSLCPSPIVWSNPHYSDAPETDIRITLGGEQDASSSCSFFGIENGGTQVGGVHLLSHPYRFPQAERCNYSVKFSLDRNAYLHRSEGRAVCDKELGMKVQDVHVWHNFSLHLDRFSYTDLIANYDRSPYDVACLHQGAKFAVMLFLTSKFGKCVLLVQQYALDHFRGCSVPDLTGGQIRFCGAYPCVSLNGILQDLKLIRRRPTVYPNQEVKKQVSQQELPYPSPQSPPVPPTIAIFVQPEPTTEFVPADHVLSANSIDWTEWGVRLFFPLLGICFTLLLFRILKQRANELCGRQGRSHGSSASIDKQGA